MENKKHSLIIEIFLFTFLFFTIFSRVYLETAVFAQKPFFSYFVATHHCAWFTFVFFYFALCARYILGLKVERIKYLTLCSPVIYIPLINAWIEDVPIKLQYLRGDFSKVLFDIFTLYRFSEQDSFFFFEMLALLVIFTVLSYIISRSVLRTVLNIIIGFYGSMFLAGLQLFGVAPKTKAYFPVHTVFKNHVFLSLVYFTAVIVAFSICFAPEIKALFKRDFDFSRMIAVPIAGTVPAVLTLVWISPKLEPFIADSILLSFSCTTVITSAILLKKGTNLPGNRFFPALFSAVSLIIMLGIIFKTGVFI